MKQKCQSSKNQSTSREMKKTKASVENQIGTAIDSWKLTTQHGICGGKAKLKQERRENKKDIHEKDRFCGRRGFPWNCTREDLINEKGGEPTKITKRVEGNMGPKWIELQVLLEKRASQPLKCPISNKIPLHHLLTPNILPTHLFPRYQIEF